MCASVNKYVKRDSTSSVTMETHTKTIMRYYWTSIKMLKKKNKKKKTLTVPYAVEIFKSRTITQTDTDTSGLLAGFIRGPVLKTIS